MLPFNSSVGQPAEPSARHRLRRPWKQARSGNVARWRLPWHTTPLPVARAPTCSADS